MSLIHPKDTLAYHKARPLSRVKSLYDVPCHVFAAKLKDFQQNYPDRAQPETEALRFYQLNHAVALISKKFMPDEPLPQAELSLVTDYYEQTGVAAQRAMFYLLIICTREMRHMGQGSKSESWVKKLTAEYGFGVGNYFKSLPPDSGQAMHIFGENPPAASIGAYTAALSKVFHDKPTWPSSSYGGKNWGIITDVLCAFIQGKTSLEVLIDTVWTLRHNTAPIFNKGMLYHQDNGEALVRILDVQRAGFIPTMIATGDSLSKHYLTPDIKATNKLLHSLFEFPAKLDYEQIVSLGATLTWGGHSNSTQKVKPKTPKPAAPKKAEKELFVDFATTLTLKQRAA